MIIISSERFVPVTYEYLMELSKDHEFPLSGKNVDDEDMIFELRTDVENNVVFIVTTLQKNNWCKVNTYHKDGTIEETYNK